MHIFALQKSIPPAITTGEFLEAFRKKANVTLSDRLIETIESMKINRRATSINLDHYFENDVVEVNKPPSVYFTESIEHSLAVSGFNREDIAGLVITSSTPDYMSPSLSSLVIPRLSLRRDITHYTIGGMGCAASVLQVELINSLLSASPDQVWIAATGDFCMPFIPSIEFFRGQTLYSFEELLTMNLPDDEKKLMTARTNYFVQTFLFGDAAVSYLAAGDRWWKEHNPGLPNITVNRVKKITNLKLEDSKAIYFPNGMAANPDIPFKRINYHMSKYVVKSILRYLKDLTIDEDAHTWDEVLLHTGSYKIIRSVVKRLHLTEKQVARSKKILANYGNVSNGALPLMWEDYSEENKKEHSRTLNLSFGIGFIAAMADMTFHAA